MFFGYRSDATARTAAAALTAVCCICATLTAAPAVASVADGQGAATKPVSSATLGLPEDMPAAAYRPEPRLPAPSTWPAGEAFPRTSGTGRLAGGAFFWTDFLYDDHGALGAPGVPAESGVPSNGGYTYSSSAARGNGADIFRAAVAATPDGSVWRVDWNTLVDPALPIAEWALDRDDNAQTGGSSWPAAAGLTSPGIDTALLMSSSGTRVIDVATGRVLATLPTSVDAAARSFVVRVPRTVLPLAGRWRLRLAAGVANSGGTSFATPQGALPGRAAVYNVAFRTAAQEAPGSYNFWNDNAQARALAASDVSAFSSVLDWNDLRSRRWTPEPFLRGWSERWYVSSVELGQGRITDTPSISDDAPNYLGRVQPYAVYVPSSYQPNRPAPLTFLLHSLTQNHNQYAATTPRFVQQACEARRSVCVTTLGRGPDGFYYGTAELDFWQVWNRVAAVYRLDPDRTVLSGYSMGGLGSNALAMAHPDLFARAVTLAGAVGDRPALENLREVPVYLAGGAEDELVPVTAQQAQAAALDRLGYRYRWLLYPAEDHVALELQDGFSDGAAYMSGAVRTRRPARVTFRWTPRDMPPVASPSTNGMAPVPVTQRPDLGVTTTGAYWLRDLKARSAASDAHIDARSSALPDPTITPQTTRGILVPGDPSPAVATELTWTLGGAAMTTPRIEATLSNVAAVTLRLTDAGIAPHEQAIVTVVSDGPLVVTFAGSVSRTVRLPAGRSVISVTG